MPTATPHASGGRSADLLYIGCVAQEPALTETSRDTGVDRIVRLVLGVARLGEADLRGWWSCHGLDGWVPTSLCVPRRRPHRLRLQGPSRSASRRYASCPSEPVWSSVFALVGGYLVQLTEAHREAFEGAVTPDRAEVVRAKTLILARLRRGKPIETGALEEVLNDEAGIPPAGRDTNAIQLPTGPQPGWKPDRDDPVVARQRNQRAARAAISERQCA